MINKKRERQEEVKKVKEIPGFYYDYEKNRYFSNKNAHNQSYSDFLSNKNKTIVKNKMIDFSFNINLFNTNTLKHDYFEVNNKKIPS